MASTAAISVQALNFSHDSSAQPTLIDLNISLPTGSRTILIGANGAGKSTLLQILAGKRLTPSSSAVLIYGRDVFRSPPEGITFLGTEWASNPVVRGDIAVSHFLDSVGGYRHKDRRDVLLDILDVDLDWRMHKISDGERRRVQLVMGLMGEWDVLLLDEVTVDLDVLVRDALLNFLRHESESRGATILYATHIFDGLNAFPTHVAHMRLGRFVGDPITWPPTPEAMPQELLGTSHASVLTPGSSLHTLALGWLAADRKFRRALESSGKHKSRGARKTDIPTDSETFYRKYDYTH